MPSRSRVGFGTVLAVLVVATPVSMLFALGLGPVPIPLSDVWRSMLGGLTGNAPADIQPALQTVVVDIRAPRVVLGALVGAGLALIGATIQALLRNALADPYIIGISSGAALGAVSVILLGVGTLTGLTLAGGAFLGALGAFALVLLLARRDSALAPTRLILAGVAVAALLSAITDFIVIDSDDQNVRTALYWTLGSLSGVEWSGLPVPLLAVVGIGGYLVLHGRQLNAMSLGEETATTLGLAPDRLRRRLVVASALLTGVLVSVSGGIGFVALMIPHITRLLVGADHRRVLPISAALGALFLVWVDVGARIINQPQEMPIGVITAAIGAPAFLILLQRRQRQEVGR